MKTIILGSLLLLAFHSSAQSGIYCNPGTPGFQECEAILCTVCNLDGYSGSNEGYMSDPDGDIYGASQFCGLNTSIQYIRFFAESPSLVITVTMGGCTPVTGIDLAVMPGCDQPVVGCVQGNGGPFNTLILNNLIVGDLYVLIINIDAVGVCHYIVHVTPPNGTIPPELTIPANMSIHGDFSVCPGATAIYQTDPADFIGTFTWTGPPGTTINGVASPEPVVLTDISNVEIQWGNTGGQICVTAQNNCGFSVTKCQNVTVSPIPPTILPDQTICAEDAPAELPWGSNAYTTGIYQTTVPSYLGCDSMLQQKVIVLPSIVTNMSPMFLCKGDCIQVCGDPYCDYGSYTATCQAVNGCDSVINFTLMPPNTVAHISGINNLNCAVDTVILHSDFSPGTKHWLNGTGMLLGTGNDLVVTMAGMYILEVSALLNGVICSIRDTVNITGNTLPPVLTASGATIECDSSFAVIHASTNANPALYQWTGPDGFMSNLPNPMVNIPGTYFISVTDLTSACTATDTVLVIPCCHTFSGTFDSLPVFICGANNLTAGFHADQVLTGADSLFFILSSNPADPLGSAFMTSPAPTFPFVPGLQQFDTIYYVFAVAAPANPDHSVDFNGFCISVSAAQPVFWAPRPDITLVAAPVAICKDEDCLDVSFHFTGAPPFQFHYNIYQNGQLQFAGDETSVTADKTITVCTSQFNQPLGLQDLNFQVNFLQDARCNCSN